MENQCLVLNCSKSSHFLTSKTENYICIINWNIFFINVWIMWYGQVIKWQNLRWILNILVVVFLNCSCEINFRVPSRYKKGCIILVKKSTVIRSFFFETAKNKKVNKQSNFNANFYMWQPVQMTWSRHKFDCVQNQPLLCEESKALFPN
jgi:hypothetical protein